MTSNRETILRYVKDQYDARPDYPWAKFPGYAVLRHGDSDRWFALIMDVPRGKVGLEGAKKVDVLDVKCDPQEIGALRTKSGYLPAYHMNKEHWITVLLDGSVPLEEITYLIDKSYNLTR